MRYNIRYIDDLFEVNEAMYQDSPYTEYDYERSRQRRLERRRRRLRKRRLMRLGAVAVLLVAAVGLGVWLLGDREEAPSDDTADAFVAVDTMPEEPVEQLPPAELTVTEDTQTISQEISSRYALVVDAATGEIIARRSSDARMYPASMTKVLTLLVAVENLPDLDATWTMTLEAGNFTFANGCSAVGYEVDEVVTVEDMLYGCILCSGADACWGLAELAAGSQESFMDLMTEKLAELGLDDTAHFTNCVGLYDEDHYCTAEDMALIMKAAMDNDLCRQILTTRYIDTAPTNMHPEGLGLSNWFIRRIEDKDAGAVTVLGGKTGFVDESGFCAVSYGEDTAGRGYICVTADAVTNWASIYDHVELYRTYCGDA